MRAGTLPRVRAHPLALGLAFVAVLIVAPGEGPAAPLASCLAVWLAMPLLVIVAVQSESPGRTRLMARIGSVLSEPVYVLQDGLYLFAALVVARYAALPLFAYAAAATLTLALAPLTDKFFDRPVRRKLSHLADMGASVPSLAPTL